MLRLFPHLELQIRIFFLLIHGLFKNLVIIHLNALFSKIRIAKALNRVSLQYTIWLRLLYI